MATTLFREPAQSEPPRAATPRRRRWLGRVPLLIGLLSILIWLLPALIATTPLRNVVLNLAQPSLPPGTTVGSATLSWTGPVQLRDVRIADEAGREMLRVESIESEQSLWQLATERLTKGLFHVVRPRLTLTSKKYTNKLVGYQLRYKPPGRAEVRDPQLVDLHEGWNLVTRTVDGFRRTLLVFGDATPPTFRATSVLTVSADALAGGYTLKGYVADNSIGSDETSLTKTYNDLPTRPIQTRPDGTRFIALDLRITDKAGNATDLVLELNVV